MAERTPSADRTAPTAPDDAPVTPAATGHVDPATAQVVPPEDDDQQHSDLGQVSGGLGEEGVAREHHDG